VVSAFIDCDSEKDLTGMLPTGFDVSFICLSERMLLFREQLFDGVEIGAVKQLT
jgi:hypothetical protein